MTPSRATSLAIALLVLSACSNHTASTASAADSISALQTVRAAADPDGVDWRRLIGALIDGRDPALRGITSAERHELEELYPDRAPLWLDADGRPGANLRDALIVLHHCADEGLNPAEYQQEIVTRLMPDLETASLPPQDRARLDVAISAGMLRFLRHLHIGRIDPRTIGLRLETARDQHDFAALLRAGIAEHRVLDLVSDLRPTLAQYRLLRSMLPRYRAMAADPALVPTDPFTKPIHPGDVYGAVGQLFGELVALGDLPPDAPAPAATGRYEADVAEGVKRFQVRHGLEPDGVLGKSTVAALRVPLAWRVRQIEMALERLRWLPHVGDQRLIALNIPMFRFWAWDKIPPSGAPLFGMDVIVGRALSTETPVFVAQMGEVIFRPYWNIPRSILRHEVLPKLERDPDYLRREDMEIVRGESDRAEHVDATPEALAGVRAGALRVRQRPGPKNALGLIKFVFPNRDDVYMHGTPAQALFARSRRDFSHGCVRVADPVALAEWVLRDRHGWSRDRIVAATIGTETIHVQLPQPIQVILFYTTAAVMPEDGTIRFADDIYRRDLRLDQALSGGR